MNLLTPDSFSSPRRPEDSELPEEDNEEEAISNKVVYLRDGVGVSGSRREERMWSKGGGKGGASGSLGKELMELTGGGNRGGLVVGFDFVSTAPSVQCVESVVSCVWL